MIISYLQGGLGNQMFQFAAGKSLAKRLGSELQLDLSWYHNSGVDLGRRFGLRDMSAKERESGVLTRVAFNWPEYFPFNRFSPQFWRTIRKMSGFTLYREPHFHVDSHFFNLEGNVYLKGFFASAEYFKDYGQEIRKDFQIKSKPPQRVRAILEKMKEGNSTALHIRRGDYANNLKTKKYHGLLPLAYYKNAMELMKTKVKKSRFYVFSDDLTWAKENLGTSNTIYFVDDARGNEIEDLRMMSQCKHFIVANSTFSWWAAWLNENVQKMVIAPKPWFANAPSNTRDLIPKSWIQLNAKT